MICSWIRWTPTMKDKLVGTLMLLGGILIFVVPWLVLLRMNQASTCYILGGVFTGSLMGICIIYIIHNDITVHKFKMSEKYNLPVAVGMAFVLHVLLSINENIDALVIGISALIALTVLSYLIIQLWIEHE